MHDAAVIGGGPAGSTAALLLARAGRKVLLLERERAAHDKVCGEFISGEAAHYLRLLGLDLEALGARAIGRLRLYEGGRLAEAELPFPACSLPRRVLDEALLEMAGQAGAELRRGEPVRTLARQDSRWRLAARSGAVWHADCVFLACGKHDLRGWARAPQRGDGKLAAFKMPLRLAPRQQEALRGHVEIHLFGEGYAGLEAVAQDRANLCCLLGKDVYTGAGKHWAGLLAWLRRASPHLDARLAGAVALRERPLGLRGPPYGYLYEPAAPEPHLYRLGDQAAVIPSFAGDGIAMALHSAFLAAEACLQGAGPAAYHRQARKAFRGPLRYAGLLAALAASAAGRKWGFRLLRLSPALLQQAIRRTRGVGPRDVFDFI